MDFITFGTWTLLPLNPWYQKISNIKHYRMDFCVFNLFFFKNEPSKIHTPFLI